MYSISIIIYEMLTGHYPYPFPNTFKPPQANNQWPEYTPLENYRDDLLHGWMSSFVEGVSLRRVSAMTPFQSCSVTYPTLLHKCSNKRTSGL